MDIKDKAQWHLQRLDVVVRACEIKWGACFMIEKKVPAELWAKFQRQWDALSAAITSCDYEIVPDLADGAVRGVWALEKAAMDAGHVPEALCTPGAVDLSPRESPGPKHEIQQLPPDFWKNGGDTLAF